jgi:hypothetical protein
MIALVLAAMVSLESTLPAFSEFLGKAEIVVPLPLTPDMITRKIIHPEDGEVTVRVKSRYYLSYWAGRVREFADRDEDPSRMMTRLDPAEMKKWAEQPCHISETNALEIAQAIFQRLGYPKEEFEPPEVNRYRWQPSETNPSHVLWLPAFEVCWLKKGFKGKKLAIKPEITMVISGTTKKLIRYSVTYDLRQWRTDADKSKPPELK